MIDTVRRSFKLVTSGTWFLRVKLPFYSHRGQENLWATSEIQPASGIQFDFLPIPLWVWHLPHSFALLTQKIWLPWSVSGRDSLSPTKDELSLSCDLFFNSVLGIYCFNLPETSISVNSLLILCPGSGFFSLFKDELFWSVSLLISSDPSNWVKQSILYEINLCYSIHV